MMISGKLRNENDSETAIDEISILDDKQHHTKEFIDLLRSYYLNL